MSAGGTAAKKSPGASCTRPPTGGGWSAQKAAAALITHGLQNLTQLGVAGVSLMQCLPGAACTCVTSNFEMLHCISNGAHPATTQRASRPCLPVQQHPAHARLARQQRRKEAAGPSAHIAQGGAAVAAPVVILPGGQEGVLGAGLDGSSKQETEAASVAQHGRQAGTPLAARKARRIAPR